MIVQALVKADAEPIRRNMDLSTPLMRAPWYAHSDIVAYLLQLPAVRATIDGVDRRGRTALRHASIEGYAPIV